MNAKEALEHIEIGAGRVYGGDQECFVVSAEMLAAAKAALHEKVAREESKKKPSLEEQERCVRSKIVFEHVTLQAAADTLKVLREEGGLIAAEVAPGTLIPLGHQLALLTRVANLLQKLGVEAK